MPFCLHCGAASSEPDQRFCHSCGQALEAPAAQSAPPADAPTAVQPTTEQPPAAPGYWEQPAAPGAAGGPPPGDPGQYQYLGAPDGGAAPAKGGSNLVRILAIGAVVVALAGGAFLAYTLFFNKSGGKSPEDAVTKMFEAIADQDGVEALRMLNPGETDGFGDVYESLQKRVADAGLASDGDGKVLDAVKIELENFEVDVKPRGDNAARVYIKDGNLKITIDENKLPEKYKDLYNNADDDVLDELKDIDISEVLDDGDIEGEVFLTTIKQDGRWYVSPIATAGEYILDDEGLDPLTANDFDKVADENAPKPVTAKKPEDAIGVLVDAISSKDIEKVFAALPKDEVAAIRPFTDVIQDAIDDGSGELDLTVSDLDTDFKELDDDLGRLTINRGKLEGTIDGEDGYAIVDGVCVTSTDDEEVYDYDTGEYTTEPQESTDCIPDEVQKQAGIDSIWLILRKQDGGWQVDPRATLIDYAKKAIESIDEDLIKDAFDYANYESEDYDY